MTDWLIDLLIDFLIIYLYVDYSIDWSGIKFPVIFYSEVFRKFVCLMISFVTFHKTKNLRFNCARVCVCVYLCIQHGVHRVQSDCVSVRWQVRQPAYSATPVNRQVREISDTESRLWSENRQRYSVRCVEWWLSSRWLIIADCCMHVCCYHSLCIVNFALQRCGHYAVLLRYWKASNLMGGLIKKSKLVCWLNRHSELQFLTQNL